MKKRNIIIIVLSLVVVISTSVILFAWLVDSDKGNVEFEQPNYRDFKYNIAFTNSEEEVTLNENSLLEVIGNLKKADEAGNYLEDLTTSISFVPEVTSYLRIKIDDSWELTRTYSAGRVSKEIVPMESSLNYLLADGWYYDQESSYIYYQELVLKADEAIEIPFIIGGVGVDTGDSMRYTDTYRVIIDFVCDIVQANRYQEVWGIEAIPNGGEELGN